MAQTNVSNCTCADHGLECHHGRTYWTGVKRIDASRYSRHHRTKRENADARESVRDNAPSIYCTDCDEKVALELVRWVMRGAWKRTPLCKRCAKVGSHQPETPKLVASGRPSRGSKRKAQAPVSADVNDDNANERYRKLVNGEAYYPPLIKGE